MPKDITEASEEHPRLHQTIFPLQITATFPIHQGADCGGRVKCEDGHIYAVKDTRKGSSPNVPHSEWFCSALSEAINIPAPTFKVLRTREGERVFGSRWLTGVIDPKDGNWWDRVKANRIPLDQIVPILSRIYAFDQFVCNTDRHGNNFLWHGPEGEVACIAMDYSRAWLANEIAPNIFPLPLPPLPASTKTVLFQRQFSEFVCRCPYVSEAYINETLADISNIPLQKIRSIIDEQPDEWLPEILRDAICGWWGSQAMFARIEAISAGAKNGAIF